MRYCPEGFFVSHKTINDTIFMVCEPNTEEYKKYVFATKLFLSSVFVLSFIPLIYMVCCDLLLYKKKHGRTYKH
jgi:hypothetical protein